MNFLGIGGLEVIVIALLGFLLLGPKRLTEGARATAKALGELRRQRDELTEMVKEAVDVEGVGSAAGVQTDGLGDEGRVSSRARPGGDRASRVSGPPASDQTFEGRSERET